MVRVLFVEIGRRLGKRDTKDGVNDRRGRWVFVPLGRVAQGREWGCRWVVVQVGKQEVEKSLDG